MSEDDEHRLARGIANRTGRWPSITSTAVRYYYRDADGEEQSRDVEFGPGTKHRERIDALRTAMLYARRDHNGKGLGEE